MPRSGTRPLPVNACATLWDFARRWELEGLPGWYVARATRQQIGNDFIRFAAGIATGLLVGLGVGMVMHPILRRAVKTPDEN